MCGRFYDLFDLDDITTRFRVERHPREPLPLRHNLAPTQEAPVIRFDGDERELVLMRWGLIPRWAIDEKAGYRMINGERRGVSPAAADTADFPGKPKAHELSPG
jgi:putative SOS response-associated peptidase YedK